MTASSPADRGARRVKILPVIGEAREQVIALRGNTVEQQGMGLVELADQFLGARDLGAVTAELLGRQPGGDADRQQYQGGEADTDQVAGSHW